MKKIIIDILRDRDMGPLDEEELLAASGTRTEEAGDFLAQLDELEAQGLVIKTKKKKYILPEKVGLIPGKMSRSKKNFGFVIPADEAEGDIFVPAPALHGAMNGDTVLVSITSEEVKAGGAGSREGEVARIVTRAAWKFAGIYENSGRFGFVTGTGTGEDFYISKANKNGAADGDRVVIKVTEWPDNGRKAEAKVLEVLGKADDSEALMKCLVFQHGLRQEFSESVLTEAASIPVDITQKEIDRRRDLRDKVIVTIDGPTAKDLDDAVCVEKLDNGNYLLGVHIADVAHYVTQGSKIDAEAYKRGTSVYFIDKVIPMLPEALSNGVCSLNPHVPRLTLSCEMEIKPDGEIVSQDIFESVIQTTERLVYGDISDIIENDDPVQKERYKHIMKEILLMNELAAILRKKRMDRGSIDFDLDETYISVDESGNVTGVGIAERRVANRIIEEFMLAANTTVSEHFYWMELPFMYRIHERPDAEKIMVLKDFLWNLGCPLKGSAETIHPKALNDVIDEVKGSDMEHVVNTVVLRAMSKARYSPDPLGHFGLGFKYYSHFTSPIRRYPDLLIHRIIKEYLRGEWNEDRDRYYRGFLPEAARETSACELEAERMERDAEKLKIAEYMQQFIGEEFEGVISGVISSGFFVEIGNTIEGFVRVATVRGDYYNLDKERYRFIGERTGNMYSLGDRVTVTVVEADPEKREVNFEIYDEDQKRSGRRGEGYSGRYRRDFRKKDRDFIERFNNGCMIEDHVDKSIDGGFFEERSGRRRKKSERTDRGYDYGSFSKGKKSQKSRKHSSDKGAPKWLGEGSGNAKKDNKDKKQKNKPFKRKKK